MFFSGVAHQNPSNYLCDAIFINMRLIIIGKDSNCASIVFRSNFTATVLEIQLNLSNAISLQQPQRSRHTPTHTERWTQICKQTQRTPARGGRQRTAGNVSTVRRGRCHSKRRNGRRRLKRSRAVLRHAPASLWGLHPWRAVEEPAENLVCSSTGNE